MDSFSQNYRSLLTERHQPPCISIYLPTHLNYPDNLQDPIRFRNSIHRVEKSLSQKYPDADADTLLAPLKKLAEDKEFWNNTHSGLAVLAAGGESQVYSLQASVAEAVVVDDRFFTKPLVDILEPMERYHVLGVELNKIYLFEGTRYSIREIELHADAPKTIEDALGALLTEKYTTISSGARGAPSTFHGTGARKDEVDSDATRYFRIIDRWMLERYSRPSGLPLILASLPEHQKEFHSISKNPDLEAEGIEADPASLTGEEMREQATKIIERHRIEFEGEILDRFNTVYGHGGSSSDIAEIAHAAVDGRVWTLLMESGRTVRGTLDEKTGSVEYLDEEDAPELLEQLAEMSIRNGGEIVVLPPSRMPSTSGAAAIFRF
ncbi:MAG: hypothetical protein JJE36_01260 [Coriobacteriia bacterium]|nr:hypothetical protein [Coriobacteriia bacterium]